VLLIALTGWGQDEDKRRTLEAGFDFHLVKPADPSRLKQLFAHCKAARARGDQ
jgi:CheY-like chemotaxis protein